MRVTAANLALMTLLVLCPHQACALGGSSKSESDDKDRLQKEAVKLYNKGLKHRDKAWKKEKQAAETKSAKKRAKHQTSAQKEYKRAIKAFSVATQKNPQFHEAFGSLGYAYRKTGDYKAALEAYDRALTLSPDYTEAIEYRGEAYLGLNRIDDARVAYYQLLNLSPKQAVELLRATKRWVKRQREAEATSVSQEVLDLTQKWISEKEEAGSADEPEESDSW